MLEPGFNLKFAATFNLVRRGRKVKLADSGSPDKLARSPIPDDRFFSVGDDPVNRRWQLAMSASAVERSLRRMSHEIIERAGDLQRLALVGICTRGAPLAGRIAKQIGIIEGVSPEVGQLDITMHRDDLSLRSDMREIAPSQIKFELDGLEVVLVDDVIFTGRSVRAALNALGAYGRPARVQLAVLVDRGHRELPIRPDFVGKNIPTQHGDHVRVQIEEVDGQDAVGVSRTGQ